MIRKLFLAVVVLAGSVAVDGVGDVTAQEPCPATRCFGVGIGDGYDGEEDEVVCWFSHDLTFHRQYSWIAGHVRHSYIDTNYYMYDMVTQEAWIRSSKSCSDGTSRPYWRVITPDPRILVEPLYDEAVGMLFAPVADLSPVHRGVVNLGMWLAVVPPRENPVVAEAVAGTAWARMTATLVSTTFDMGNGDVVVCSGFGTPIPESEKNDIAESPTCGYTYRSLDGAPYTVTMTSRWEFTWETSNGASGTQPAVDLSTSFEYQIIEIVTVGSERPGG